MWNTVITDKGVDLIKDTLTGDNIEITSIKAGAGKIASENLKNATDLSDKKQSGMIQSVTSTEDGLIKINVLFTNVGIKTTYKMTQIGVYVKDKSNNEILFLIAQDDGKEVPSETSTPWALVHNFYIKMSNDVNIVANINQDGYVTFETMQKEIDTRLLTITEDNPEFLRVYLDADGKILWGIRRDGMIVYGAGVPEQIQKEIADLNIVLSKKISDLDESMGAKLNTAIEELGYSEDNPEYLRVIIDSEGKVLWGIRNDGNIVYGVGIPEQIQEALDTLDTNVKDLRKDVGTFGLYLDENGNICQEVQE